MACLALSCHPVSPEPAARTLHVRIQRPAPDQLQLCYRLEGDIAALRVPEPAPPVQTDGLWRGTCFEAFVRAAGATAYLEVNAAPSGAWALYAFDRYRDGMRPLSPARPPRVDCRGGDTCLQVEVQVDLGGQGLAARELELGIAAVLENARGALSYWALTHPGARPDFHDPSGFTGRLAP